MIFLQPLRSIVPTNQCVVVSLVSLKYYQKCRIKLQKHAKIIDGKFDALNI